MISKTALVVASYLAESIPPQIKKPQTTQHIVRSGNEGQIDKKNSIETTLGMKKETPLDRNMNKTSQHTKMLYRDHIAHNAKIPRPKFKPPKSI